MSIHTLPSFVADKRSFFSTPNVDALTIAQVENMANSNFKFLTQDRISMRHEQEDLYACLQKNGNNRHAFWLYCYKVSFELKTYYATYSPQKAKYKKYEKLCMDIAKRINGEEVVAPPRVSLLAQLDNDVSALTTKTRLTELTGWLNMQRLSTRFTMITVKLALLFARQYQLLDNLEWLFGRQFNIAILDTPLSAYNALSVGLFGFRFLLQVAMMLKHTLLPHGAESKLTMAERFYEEFKARHFQMTNDVVWGVVNGLCNFGTYTGVSAPVANALMLIFTVFDMAWLAYALYATDLEYSLKRNEYTMYRYGLVPGSDAWNIATEQLEILELGYTKDMMTLIFYMLAACMMIASFTVGFVFAPPVFLPLCFLVCNFAIAMYLSGDTFGEWRKSHLVLEQEIKHNIDRAEADAGVSKAFNNLVFTIGKNTLAPFIILTAFTLNVPAAIAITAAYFAYDTGYLSKAGEEARLAIGGLGLA